MMLDNKSKSIIHQSDDNGWIDLSITKDPKQFPEGIVDRFLSNIPHSQNHQRNIIKHFNEAIDDRGIKSILDYFADYAYSWGTTSIFGKIENDDFYVVQKDLYFRNEENTWMDMTFITIEKNDYFHEHRISAIRILNPPRWIIKKTILTMEQQEHKWSRIQNLFLKPLMAL
jgi:hypothetical protein